MSLAQGIVSLVDTLVRAGVWPLPIEFVYCLSIWRLRSLLNTQSVTA